MSESYNQWADTASEGLQTPLQTPERRPNTSRPWSAPDAREFIEEPYTPPPLSQHLPPAQQQDPRPPINQPKSSPPNQPGKIETIPTSCNLRMVVLNASLSSFSSGYCCASIAGAILFLQQDTLFFPLPSPDPNPSNYSPSPSSSSSSNSSNHTNYTAPTPGWYGYPTNANIHSCMSSQGANTATPSSSSSDLVLDALMSDFQRGWLVSCILLSALIGALFASSVADTIGRRPTQIFTNLFFIVGCAGMYFAPNNIDHNDDHGYWILVGARALTGLGVGISSVLVNLYITEISPAKSRGELGGWAPFAVTAGILVSYILASFIGETIAADQAWRIILGVGAVPAFLQMGISLFFEKSLPESPRWLLMHGRPVRAYQSSVLLHGVRNKNAIQQELDSILLSMMQKQLGGSGGSGGGGGNIGGGGSLIANQQSYIASSFNSTSGSSTSLGGTNPSYSAMVGLDKSWNGGIGGGSTTVEDGEGNDAGGKGEKGGEVGNGEEFGNRGVTTTSSTIPTLTGGRDQRSESDRIEAEILRVQGDMVEVDCCCRLCSRTRYRSAALAGIGINILQQVSGINVVIYFGPQLLKETGFDAVQATALTAAVSVAQLFAVAVLMKYVDTVGRRPLAFVGLGFMIIGLGTVAAAFYMLCEGSRDESSGWAWTAVVGMLIFRIAFSLSLGPLPYIVTAEVFPNEVRACGATVSWSANWIANFGVTLSFPLIKNYFAELVGGREELGSVCLFGIYIFFSFFAIGFIWKFVPETAKRALEDV